MYKIQEIILEPDKIYIGSNFLIKVKVELISENIETENLEDIMTEDNQILITEGDYYNG